MIRARIVADSMSPAGCRLITVEATYPRIVHEEVLTHRILSTDPQAMEELSRNSASGRAIPTKLWLSAIESQPFIPEVWFSNRAGMVGGEPLDADRQIQATNAWLQFRDDAVRAARRLNEIGVHKHHANRPLTPLQHITTVMSGTEWWNFFGLRYHAGAAPEFIELAQRIHDLYVASEPVPREPGEWHLPYVTEDERRSMPLHEAARRSATRCGRVSYLRQGEAGDVETELERAESFIASRHWTPTEHPAMALVGPKQIGNFTGWKQLRKFFRDEDIAPFDPPTARSRA
jgi:hypothetical protein